MLSNNPEPISIEALADLPGRLSKQDLQRIMELVVRPPEYHDGERELPGDALNCPHCSSSHVHHYGFVRGKQRYLCKECGRAFGQTTGSVRYKSKQQQGDLGNLSGGICLETSLEGSLKEVRHITEQCIFLEAKDP